MEQTPSPAKPTAGGGPAQKYKIVFLGDQYVGKTSLINRFMNDAFVQDYTATVGIDFLSKVMHLEDKTVKLQLWDTAGQERFKSLIPSYIKDSAVAVIVFDITNKVTFTNVSAWIQEVRQIRGNEALILVVGNKNDLADKRQVTEAEGKKLSDEHNSMYFEASAKTGDNVKTIFEKLALQLPGVSSPQATAVPSGPFGQAAPALSAPGNPGMNGEVNEKGNSLLSGCRSLGKSSCLGTPAEVKGNEQANPVTLTNKPQNAPSTEKKKGCC